MDVSALDVDNAFLFVGASLLKEGAYWKEEEGDDEEVDESAGALLEVDTAGILFFISG